MPRQCDIIADDLTSVVDEKYGYGMKKEPATLQLCHLQDHCAIAYIIWMCFYCWLFLVGKICAHLDGVFIHPIVQEDKKWSNNPCKMIIINNCILLTSMHDHTVLSKAQPNDFSSENIQFACNFPRTDREGVKWATRLQSHLATQNKTLHHQLKTVYQGHNSMHTINTKSWFRLWLGTQSAPSGQDVWRTCQCRGRISVRFSSILALQTLFRAIFTLSNE